MVQPGLVSNVLQGDVENRLIFKQAHSGIEEELNRFFSADARLLSLARWFFSFRHNKGLY